MDRLPKREDTVNIAVMKEENRVECSNASITHVTTNRTMNPIMYTFQGVAGAAAIANCVVAESRPVIHK
jgi:hypothetical protein